MVGFLLNCLSDLFGAMAFLVVLLLASMVCLPGAARHAAPAEASRPARLMMPTEQPHGGERAVERRPQVEPVENPVNIL